MMGSGADLGIVVGANLWNVLLIGVFLARVRQARHLEDRLGLAAVALALPIAAFAAANARAGRPWWAVVLPGLVVAYSLVELVLDYLLRLDFRHTRFLGPYLLLFYVAQWAMIGYGFAVGRAAGFATLATYFLCLAATGYSYSRVGHGSPASPIPATGHAPYATRDT